jgi:hypothetical protein
MNLKSLATSGIVSSSVRHRSIQFAIGALSVTALLSNPNAASAVTMTYEAPNVFSASPSVGTTAKNDFETPSTGNILNYVFDFTDATSGNPYQATYDNLYVADYGQNGKTAGAGYTGKFAVSTQSVNVTVPQIQTTNITFTDVSIPSSPTSAGIKYFGLFFSSLDDGNELTFYNGSTEIARLSISNFSTLVNNSGDFTGGPYLNEPSAFFNFYADAGEQFTRIALTQTTLGGGFENDNHTFRIPDAEAISGTGVNLSGLNFSGNVTTAVPEPFTIIGTLVGGTAAFRLRKKLKAANK